ncbi:hypothetical protein NOF04DRAFT_21009 [Fusarium oxysporum II5]|uniref:Uncharacterized protein n=1 Tax=Fusarium odoratissimum (strain NRRL 54006) TaxID=1089451 RepID=X0JP82_FUSO5|nr:uncharacterized protein FOIG_05998 [Fusarium odoratissimum NRRL 54006]EXM03094.1 hypothetical protein FOIG_05998 [Fusarium odoratissimum NRRL 54006]KAK2134885.1 hypothetical protein NOF04DRAFT_21009 [Fusarium oxysporum II5]
MASSASIMSAPIRRTIKQVKLQIYDTLEVEQPIIGGVFSRPFSEKLRFATISDAQGFKIKLVKLQNAMLDQQKQQDIDRSQVADNTEERKAEDDGEAREYHAALLITGNTFLTLDNFRVI